MQDADLENRLNFGAGTLRGYRYAFCGFRAFCNGVLRFCNGIVQWEEIGV